MEYGPFVLHLPSLFPRHIATIGASFSGICPSDSNTVIVAFVRWFIVHWQVLCFVHLESSVVGVEGVHVWLEPLFHAFRKVIQTFSIQFSV